MSPFEGRAGTSRTPVAPSPAWLYRSISSVLPRALVTSRISVILNEGVSSPGARKASRWVTMVDIAPESRRASTRRSRRFLAASMRLPAFWSSSLAISAYNSISLDTLHSAFWRAKAMASGERKSRRKALVSGDLSRGITTPFSMSGAMRSLVTGQILGRNVVVGYRVGRSYN